MEKWVEGQEEISQCFYSKLAEGFIFERGRYLIYQ
jgi:hypothetical protein